MGQSIEEIEDQLKEIKRWEDRETRKIERKEEHRIRVAEQRRREKELADLDNRGSEIDKAALKKERWRIASAERRRQSAISGKSEIDSQIKAVKTLAKRLRCIPNNFKCKQCGVKKTASKQWVVDLVNGTAVCRVCFELNKRQS